ncbi:MAG: hypothetical protein JW849_00145 [Phycisphaerae bacterium]|nr:hypothetical protein [Phycisphaerae bacterium]
MKSGKTTLTYFWAAGLILAAGAAPGCSSVRQKNHQADATANVVLKLLAAGRADALYENYTTEHFRQANAREVLQKLSQALQQHLGAPEDHSLLEFHLRTASGHASGEYLYKVRWAKAEGTLHLGLLWQDDAWKIQTLDIRSPAIDAARNAKPVNTGETIHI